MTNISPEPLALNVATEKRLEVSRRRDRRLLPGVRTSAHDWASADDRTRHLTRMLTVAGTRRDDVVFVGLSAAAVWGLPVVGAWSEAVEALAGRRPASRSRAAVLWHQWSVPDEDIQAVGPWLVTGLERTLTDLARHASFVSAVAAIDHGLKDGITSAHGCIHVGCDREDLLDRLRRERNSRGRSRALAAISFADPLSGSPGESLSRVQMHRLGFASPLLQSRVEHTSGGGADYPDFEWEGAYGEFDCGRKYFRTGNPAGLSAGEVVWNEKRREDRLRMNGKAVARWTWEDAWNPPRLRAILLSAGVEQVRRAAFSPDAFGEWVVNA